MKKLLGLLTLAPITLAACGSAKHPATEAPKNETVVEIHEDKAHLLNLYQVQNYEAVGTAIRGSVQFYMEAKDGADLTEWTWKVEVETDKTLKPSGLLDTSVANIYDLGHDINSDRVVNFSLYLLLTAADDTNLDAADIEAYHNDTERGEARVAAFNAITSTTPTAEIAAIKNEYVYEDESGNTPEVDSFFTAINLIGTDADGTEYITDMTIIAE